MELENIKFKAKALNSGKWVVGDLLHRITDTCIAVKDIDDIVYYPVDPSTVCQFTGLKDCEGNEVWEHDLLQSQGSKEIYEVAWSKEGGFIAKGAVSGGRLLNFLYSVLMLFVFKVIGNKFDKKE